MAWSLVDGDIVVDEIEEEMLEEVGATEQKKPAEFVDWNTFTLDQHCEILENEFRFSSSGIARSVFELIDFYKKNIPNRDTQ